MADRCKHDLARIGAQSSKLTAAARASCEETQDHINASRKAIARSLEALAQPFTSGLR
jgi:hypothetical protein